MKQTKEDLKVEDVEDEHQEIMEYVAVLEEEEKEGREEDEEKEEKEEERYYNHMVDTKQYHCYIIVYILLKCLLNHYS